MNTFSSFFILFLINMKNQHNLLRIFQPPYLTPSVVVVLKTSFLMGLGEAAFNTQIISLISSQFTGNTSQAFALYKLVQSVGISVGFAASTRVGLYWQIAGRFKLNDS